MYFCHYKKLYFVSIDYVGMQMKVLRIAALGLILVIFPFIGYSQGKQAFMVGISTYSSNLHFADCKGWDDIHGENDVKLLAPTLKKQGFSVQKLCNREATASNDSVVIRGTDKGFSKSNKQYAPRIDKRGKIRVEKSANMANICILEACRSYQVNSEIIADGKYYGSLSFYVNKALKSVKLDKNISWTERVTQLMNQDTRLVRQNPVIETSL